MQQSNLGGGEGGRELFTAVMDDNDCGMRSAEQCNNQIERQKKGNKEGNDEEDRQGQGKSKGDNDSNFLIQKIVLWQY